MQKILASEILTIPVCFLILGLILLLIVLLRTWEKQRRHRRMMRRRLGK